MDAVVDKVDGERRLLNLTVQAVGGDVIYDERSEGGALSGEFASLNLKENRSTDFRLTFSEPLTALLEFCVFDLDVSMESNGQFRFQESVTACGNTGHFTIEDLTDSIDHKLKIEASSVDHEMALHLQTARAPLSLPRMIRARHTSDLETSIRSHPTMSLA